MAATAIRTIPTYMNTLPDDHLRVCYANLRKRVRDGFNLSPTQVQEVLDIQAVYRRRHGSEIANPLLIHEREAPEPVAPIVPEKLVSFLYLLMRDELPTGAVAKIIKEINRPDLQGVEVNFTNRHLEAYARELAETLVGG